MPLIETRGALTSRAYGEFSAPSVVPNYIEDVFSTYLYTGNGTTQTITNGIDLSTKGGLLWIKGRSATSSHWLVDTARGNTKGLYSDSSVAEQTSTGGADVSGFLSSGFSLGSNQQALVNTNGGTFASWSFRKQAKFFDVVTYTGNGANRTIAHNLGSVPGCIIVKRTDASAVWCVYHRSLLNTQVMFLDSTLNAQTAANIWNSTTATSTVFSVGTNTYVNASGGTYVAYIFAHDAGGFGATGTDNVISCGSFTTDGSGNATVTLGWEPQWIMRKSSSSSATGWEIGDNMRGLLAPPTGSPFLTANTNLAESSLGTRVFGPTATGFTATGSPSTTYIYMAIRRGPMRTPTSGTSVFIPSLTAGSIGSTITTGFPVDAYIGGLRPSTSHNNFVQDRLRGFPASDSNPQNAPWLTTETSDQEFTSLFPVGYAFDNTGLKRGSQQGGGSNLLFWAFRRAPGFFDVVAYTGTGVSGRTVSHNLGVVPELIIIKRRDATNFWHVWSANVTAPETNWWHNYQLLNTTQAAASWTTGLTSAPTASALTVGDGSNINASAATYIAYLFASCPGVSKVGGYIGTGTTQQINCGFTGGARFVMIKRADSTSDWYVWDTARGIVAGNDPFLLLNSTSPEVTNTDLIDPLSTGFEISSAFSTNGGNYIFLAIA